LDIENKLKQQKLQIPLNQGLKECKIRGLNMSSNRILSEKVKRQVLDTIVGGLVLLIGGILTAICLLTLTGRI